MFDPVTPAALQSVLEAAAIGDAWIHICANGTVCVAWEQAGRSHRLELAAMIEAGAPASLIEAAKEATEREWERLAAAQEARRREIAQEAAREAERALQEEEERLRRVTACPRHETEREEGPLPYLYPVRPQDPNPAAHGGVRWVGHCRCGARRETLVNSCHIEVGDWC